MPALASFSRLRSRCLVGLGDLTIVRDTVRVEDRISTDRSESCRRSEPLLLALTFDDWEAAPAGRNGFRLCAVGASLMERRARSTGVLGRKAADRGPTSVLDGGRAAAVDRPGETFGFMTGNDRLRRRSCALVVVASCRSEAADGCLPISRLRGVVGLENMFAGPEGVSGVTLLPMDDVED